MLLERYSFFLEFFFAFQYKEYISPKTVLYVVWSCRIPQAKAWFSATWEEDDVRDYEAWKNSLLSSSWEAGNHL